MEKIIFKLCLNQKIHRCPKTPENYEGLLTTIKQTFKEELPEKFNLSYVDQEGDRVILHAEDDFKSMIGAFGSDVKSIKIFIAPEDQDEMPEGMLDSKSIITDSKSSFQVLLNKKEAQPEPVQEKKVEVEEKKVEVHEPKVEVQEQKPEVHEKKPEVSEQKPEAPEVHQKQVVDNEVDPRLEITMIKAKKPVEEVKEEEPVIVKEFDDQDLSKKSNLRAFIIQTIEEAMPQIMAQYMNNQDQSDKKKDENSMMKGLMNVANQISNQVEKIVIGDKGNLSGKVKKVEKTIPDVITTIDETVYAVLTIKNSGKDRFPESTFLQNVCGLYGDLVKVPPLESGKEVKITIALRGPKKAGSYITQWVLGYIDERNITKQFGEAFEFKISVIEKKYSKDAQDKANMLKSLLPQTDISVFLELASKNPNKNIEALVEEALANASN